MDEEYENRRDKDGPGGKFPPFEKVKADEDQDQKEGFSPRQEKKRHRDRQSEILTFFKKIERDKNEEEKKRRFESKRHIKIIIAAYQQRREQEHPLIEDVFERDDEHHRRKKQKSGS